MKRIKMEIVIISFIAVSAILLCMNACTENCAFNIPKYNTKKTAQSLSDLKVYPNPFKSKLGHTEITFENLSSDMTIRIYNSTGKLIWEKKNPSAVFYEWHVNNSSSRKVASGIYTYIVTIPDGKIVKGKIAVIW